MKQDQLLQGKDSILKARARALAKEPEQTAGSRSFIEIVEFCLASETYGIQSSFVREVQTLKDFTPLPGVPPFVLGIVNIHGRILSLVDLKKFFNLPDKGLGELNKVIVLQHGRMEFGVLADTVPGIRSVPLDAIQAPPCTITGIGAEYLRGVTAGHVIILAAEKILGDEKIIVHEDVT
jgi:purine-binding chemotaxis protein CheW